MEQKEINEYILKLIEDEKKEFARSKTYEYMFMLEEVEPKTMGKEKALENLAVWQKHIVSIEGRIKGYKEYIKNHE